VETGYPVLVGVSRKSFIGKLLEPEGEPAPADERLEGTLSAQVLAQAKGARIIRTHDVKAAVRASLVAGALINQEQAP
ncbi:MAG: dihydropteroate synthase, partial [Armatimonadetes bacterium]|nr:dihydropteroate synthase [Armatimonadota bacterium]